MARSDRDVKMRLAAYLRAEEHLNVGQIGERLGGIPQPTVTGLLRDARTEGLYEEAFVYRGKELSAEDDALLHAWRFQSTLHGKIAAHLAALGRERKVRVYLYDVRVPGAKEATPEARMRSFAAQAAPELRRLLTRPKVRKIGVAWGGAIAAMVEALGESKAARRSRDPITVIAMCGTPLDNPSTLRSSSAIAENLSEALNGTPTPAKTLGITPAYLPTKSHVEGADWVRGYILSAKPYLEVFGTDRMPHGMGVRGAPPGEPLADELDAFLTSVSREGGTLQYGSDKLYRTDDIDPAELEKVVYGDIGGIPLPRPGLDAAQQSVLQRVSESWTGVTYGQLQRCVSKALGSDLSPDAAKRGSTERPSSKVPGCILVAVGENKARTVYEAVIAEKLVNHLFIDFECAQAFVGLLDRPRSS